MRLRPGLAFWALGLPLIALIRIPYLSSPFYLLDNDEAVLGIMARHMAAGDGFPLYFAGQNYGLAIFETAPLALAFAVFGESTEVVALTMLALFCAGVLAHGAALTNLAGNAAWGRMLAFALALLPGWIVWSLKARGIYVSGFLLSGLALVLLTRPEPSRRDLLGAGALLGLVGLVQPLWLSVCLPFLFLVRRPVREVVAAGALSGLIWILPLVFAPSVDPYWQPRPFENLMVERLSSLPAMLLRAFSGREWPHDPGLGATLVGVTAALAFFSLIVVMAVEALRRRSRLAVVVALAMCASIMHIVALRVWVPRYFLPCTVLSVIAVAVWLKLNDIPFRRAARLTAVATVVTLALVALRVGAPRGGSGGVEVPAEDDLRALIADLEDDGIRGVYAQTSDIQWQILFYGQERIPTRGTSSEDRYPQFPAAVAEAERAGEATTYVADVRQLARDLPLDSFPGYRVGERYLRLDDPEPIMLLVLGFQPVPAVGGSR